MRSPLKQRNKGMAVLMALAVVLLLVTTAVELHMNQRTHMLNAAAQRDRHYLTQMAASGVHMAMAVLIKDRMTSDTDSLQENWADTETMTAMLSDIPFDQGELKVKIVDELGKIQINALVTHPLGDKFKTAQYHMWERFAERLLNLYETLELELEDTNHKAIIHCIKDWIDSGDDDAITESDGAESDYYEDLDPPYKCKNGPFDHLSEVRLVKGITPEIFYGMGGVAGIGDYITVYGAIENENNKYDYPGKININTAELPVVAALIDEEDAMTFAQAVIDYREALSDGQYTNDVTRADWYTQIIGLTGAKFEKKLITLTSECFRITATAKHGNTQVTTTAIVLRHKPSESEPWQCKVLNWVSK